MDWTLDGPSAGPAFPGEPRQGLQALASFFLWRYETSRISASDAAGRKGARFGRARPSALGLDARGRGRRGLSGDADGAGDGVREARRNLKGALYRQLQWAHPVASHGRFIMMPASKNRLCCSRTSRAICRSSTGTGLTGCRCQICSGTGLTPARRLQPIEHQLDKDTSAHSQSILVNVELRLVVGHGTSSGRAADEEEATANLSCKGWAQSGCRCGRGEPSPGADAAWGEPSPGADEEEATASLSCGRSTAPGPHGAGRSLRRRTQRSDRIATQARHGAGADLVQEE